MLEVQLAVDKFIFNIYLIFYSYIGGEKSSCSKSD
jgi:hypothetical protein